MRPLNLTAYFREHFSARIFLTFSVLIITVSLAFTVFFFHYQSGSLTEKTVSEGKLLARLLAHNSRLGVFTENADLLGVPVGGIMENREVLSVAVYNTDGKTLASRSRNGHSPSPASEKWDAGIGKMLKEATAPIQTRNNGDFVFWTQVELKPHIEEEDAVYFSADTAKPHDQTIGYVRVVLDGRPLLDKLHALLFQSVLIGLAFLMIGSVIAYLISGRVTKPLDRLTEGVNAFGMEGTYKEIAAERNDEIGKLAAAFNNMVDSLRKREAEKEELEEKLRHSQKMEAIGTMAGGVAHDFNNMLTAINGFGTLLTLELAEGSKARSYANQIVKAGERAAGLTHRLLTFTRKQIISPRPIKLDENIISIEKMLGRLITEDIDMQFRLDAAEAVVMADPGQLDQVLMNLVTNGRDAMPNGGALTVKTCEVTLEDDFVKRHDQEKGGRYALLTVSDCGVGIPDKVRGKIFDPFFTTKDVGKGTGLGLSMVYGIVKQHDGIIEVDTEPGKGTSFKIYLPLIERATEDRKRQIPELLRGNSETILVAEDDSAVMDLLKGLLEKNDYNVIEATNGEEAVRKFIAHRDSIRLVLLDVIMPRKNGREVYDEIVRIRPDVKALFMSGYTRDVIDWKGAIKEGISLISKPLQADELLAKLSEALKG